MPYAGGLVRDRLGGGLLRGGSEIAQPLFWHRNTQPTRTPPAKFIASWKSPSEVAPSPNEVSAIRLLPRSRSAQAIPTACTMCPPTVIDGGITFTGSGGQPPSSCPVRPTNSQLHG